MVMQIMRDPTLQFIISLVVAPLFAIVGVSLAGASASLAGWLVTLCLWSFFAVRSARHLWQSLARAPLTSIEMRLLAGITVFAVIISVTAVVVAILLLIELI
jgi:hypothetical protein